jgi:hypothetical protein
LTASSLYTSTLLLSDAETYYGRMSQAHDFSREQWIRLSVLTPKKLLHFTLLQIKPSFARPSVSYRRTIEQWPLLTSRSQSNTRGIAGYFLTGSLAHLGLGRADAIAGARSRPRLRSAGCGPCRLEVRNHYR